jgi:YfiH family protein
MLETVRLQPLRAPELDAFSGAGIAHGFFGRAGGVSEGIYRGLNTGPGSDDRPEHVAENRRRVASTMGVTVERLVTVHQVHSPDVVTVTAPLAAPRPKADAMVTDRPGLALGVLAADCGPVLYADPQARVIGAAHAGWQGALSGVLEATVEAMERLGARRERIVAVLGPSISGASYEVGPEYVARFLDADARNDAYFAPAQKPGHAMFDLPRYTVDRLAAAGVTASSIGRCTYAEEDMFFSNRRRNHRGEPDYGRQISVIVLEDR